MIRLGSGCFVILVFFLARGGRADEPLVDVGVAKIDITPDSPIRLTGYASRKTEAAEVESRLWAKALAIGSDRTAGVAEAQAPGPVVLVTVDNLGVPAQIRDAIAAGLHRRRGIADARFSICSSHTHSGPALDGVANLVLGDDLPAAEREHIARYTAALTAKIAAVAEQALDNRQPGRLAWSQGQLKFGADRRLLENGRWVGFGVNPQGQVDGSMPLLRVSGADGKLRAVLLNFACHCTTLGPDFNKIGGDWAGYAQEFIEREQPGAIALVAIGCAGDINPEPRGKLEQAVDHGQSVAKEVQRLLASPGDPLPGQISSIAEKVDLPLDRLPTRDVWAERAKMDGAIAIHARAQLARLDRGEALATSVPCRVQVWRFGDELTMVFLAGEVVVDYALRLQREFTGRRLWVSAYSNDVPCYIASKRMLGTLGYEDYTSMFYYDQPTQFAPQVEDTLISAVRRLAPVDFGAAK
jgi:hypothetical protein